VALDREPRDKFVSTELARRARRARCQGFRENAKRQRGTRKGAVAAEKVTLGLEEEMPMPAKKRSRATKAKARAKATTTKVRREMAHAIAPKRKRRKPKSLGQKMKETALGAIKAVTGK
jgi:hypothetical protein